MSHAIAQSSPSVLKHINNFTKFAKLSSACQADVINKLSSVDRMLTAQRGQKTRIAKALAEERKIGVATIYNEVKAFTKKGWKGLINKSKFPKESGSLPKTFRSQIVGFFEDQQRTDDVAEVRRTMLDRLHLWRRTGDSQYKLEGYTEPPADNPRYGHPDGWSERSFYRMRDEGYTRFLAKQGRKAASSYLPSVTTTRKGLKFLQKVYFDDQDYDNKIAVAGLSAAVRPVGFNSLDHLTGAHLGYHLRVVTKTNDEQTYKSLTGKEFTWFALHNLQTIGYRTDEAKTTYVFEHGTANSWATKKTQKLSTFSGHYSFEEAVEALTNGQVTVERSGKFNDPVFAGMLYAPSSTGNFKFKTWIESAFRLVRTYMQALPGSVGRKYELAPEELYGIELSEKQLLKAALELPQNIVQKMQHEILTYVEFAEIVDSVYRAINSRRDHNLEAWEECGFTEPLWRLSETSNHWMPRHELDTIQDPDERAYLSRKVAQNPSLTKTENLSPAEAVQKLSNDPAIAKLGREATPLLIPKEWAITKTVKSNRTITLKDPFYTKTKHQFITQLETPQGTLTIQPGTELLCYYNPFDIDNLVVCSAKGEYLGTLTRVIPRESHNTEQTLAQLEQRARLRSDLESAPRARASTIINDRQARKENNDRLKAGDYRTDAERKKDRSNKSRAKSFGKHVPAPSYEATETYADEVEDWSDEPTQPTTPEDNHNPIETEKW